ncbi:Formamidopyrimidine-DNA glycosylase N-terminal domain-containing protein [Blastocladiella britannica]|nr:Formamidopyrimidine-DNA glycosylase N-terminal domain-containing protein [Blastocladiella britannica]
MPELPEVERQLRKLDRVATGRTIASIDAQHDPIVFANTTAAEFTTALTHCTFVACHRYGKWMYCEMREPEARPDGSLLFVFIHLGMTGSLRIKGLGNTEYRTGKIAYADEAEEWPPRYWRFHLRLTETTVRDAALPSEMALSDPRRLGKVMLVRAADRDALFSVSPLMGLGFDPLLAMPNADEYVSAIRFRAAAIKSVLLDQSFAAGVGNWMADEILYQARVHPQSRPTDLSTRDLVATHTALATVVTDACGVDGDSDAYPADWLFHVRWDKRRQRSADAPVTCALGHPVEFVTVGGRTSAVVPAVQSVVLDRKARRSAAEEDRSDISVVDDGQPGDDPTITDRATVSAVDLMAVDPMYTTPTAVESDSENAVDQQQQEPVTPRRSSARVSLKRAAAATTVATESPRLVDEGVPPRKRSRHS